MADLPEGRRATAALLLSPFSVPTSSVSSARWRRFESSHGSYVCLFSTILHALLIPNTRAYNQYERAYNYSFTREYHAPLLRPCISSSWRSTRRLRRRDAWSGPRQHSSAVCLRVIRPCLSTYCKTICSC